MPSTSHLSCPCLGRSRLFAAILFVQSGLGLDSALGGSDAANGDFLAPAPASVGHAPAAEGDTAGILDSVEGRIVTLSSSPRIYQVDNFLTDAECDFLREHGSKSMGPALTIDKKTGKFNPDAQRTSQQMYVTTRDVRDHSNISNIVRRLHRWARIPVGHSEQLQIGLYKEGDKYDCHYDSDLNAAIIRPATIIMYLADVAPGAGGETAFPNGENCRPLSNCCNRNDTKALLVRPKKGRALLFYTHDLKGNIQNSAIHCSCPVIEGEKWISQQWFRSTLYENSPHYSVGKSMVMATTTTKPPAGAEVHAPEL